MRDPKVEMLFRIASVAFATRNFKSDGAANLNMGIRFDYEVLRRFYPKAHTASRHRDVRQLSREVARDSVDHTRRAVDFVESANLRDNTAVKQFTLDVAQAVAEKDLRFVGAIKSFKREMEEQTQNTELGLAPSQVDESRAQAL
jgi:hypothetical protein